LGVASYPPLQLNAPNMIMVIFRAHHSISCSVTYAENQDTYDLH